MTSDGGIQPLTTTDPTRIGPYLLLGRLGAGGMGRVYLARSEAGRTVAVKVVHEEHVADARFRARFRREIDAARRVDERHTAPVLDADPDAEPPWVATGYVPGLSLEQAVRAHGHLPTASVRALAQGLLQALHDIHTAGIVHRDLKPSNVMLTMAGPKVIDFGIARAAAQFSAHSSVESLLTSTGMVVGSPGFMSPEQIQGLSAGPESDVFALGCLLAYAATCKLPFGHEASNQHAVMYQIVEAAPDLDGIDDPELRALIARCLTKAVDERPSVAALSSDLGSTQTPTAGPSWLPSELVAHLAELSAQLLDAQAPVREVRETPASEVRGTPVSEVPEPPAHAAPAKPVSQVPDPPVDRATVGLRPSTNATGAKGGSEATAHNSRPQRARRRWAIALPVVLVVAVGGGTVALLQPFGQDKGHQSAPPSNGDTGTDSPGSPDSSSPTGDKSPPSGKDEDKGEGEKGKDGEKGADGQDAQPGTATGGSGSTDGGDATTAGASGDSGSTDSGSGSSDGGGASSGGSSGSSSGSSGGDTVPSFFIGSWKYAGQTNIGQPGTITISRTGVVRLTDMPINECPYEAQVTSTSDGGKRINIGTAKLVAANPGYCYATLDPSFMTVNGSGALHNVGPSHGEGYHYSRA